MGKVTQKPAGTNKSHVSTKVGKDVRVPVTGGSLTAKGTSAPKHVSGGHALGTKSSMKRGAETPMRGNTSFTPSK